MGGRLKILSMEFVNGPCLWHLYPYWHRYIWRNPDKCNLHKGFRKKINVLYVIQLYKNTLDTRQGSKKILQPNIRLFSFKMFFLQILAKKARFARLPLDPYMWKTNRPREAGFYKSTNFKSQAHGHRRVHFEGL